MSSLARPVLGVTRLAVGALSLAAPDTSARAFGLDPTRSSSFVGRLFGSRELALAVLLLAAEGEDVARVATVGAVVDGLDLLSGTAELARGRLSTRAAVVGVGGAAVFTALGLLVARDARS